MSLARAFLDKLRRFDDGEEPLSTFSDDAEGFGAALLGHSDELKSLLEQASADKHGPPVLLSDDCFHSAACDRKGGLVVTGNDFIRWFDEDEFITSTVRTLRPERPSVSVLVNDRSGRPVAVAAGMAAIARNWPLDPDVKQALMNGKADYAVIAYRPGDAGWVRAATAAGLTFAEMQLVIELARSGDLQIAASARGISYETARKFVGSAMRKTGSTRQTELIGRMLLSAGGEIPGAGNLEPLLRDLFGMSERQAALSMLIAKGATRGEAANILGISDSSAKEALKSAYQVAGVASAVDMARIVTEINALGALSLACDIGVTYTQRLAEPLRLVPRRWGEGRIAVSDHGPLEARPLLLFHGNLSGRHHPRSLVRSLQAAGWRPIAVERAGFGLSDFIAGHSIETAKRDLADVVAACSLGPVPAVSFGTTAGILLSSAFAAGLISGGVIVTPDPPGIAKAGLINSLSSYAKKLIWEHAGMREAFLKIYARRTSPARVEAMYRTTFKGVAADEAVLNDSETLDDFIRGSHQASIGFKGVLNELSDLDHGPNPPTIADGRPLTLLFGERDRMFDVQAAVDFWGGQLSTATVVQVEGAGHFPHLSHPESLVTALGRMV